MMTTREKISIVRQVDMKEAVVRLRSDGIIHTHYQKDTTFDVELQERLMSVYGELGNGKKVKVLSSAEEGFIFTKEARDNWTKIQHNTIVGAYAVIARSLAYRMVGNFFQKIYKPVVPFRMFKSSEEAIAWLRTLQ